MYDQKVGTIELRPGDHVLVHLDAFRGQRRKLKNRWGDDLHTVVTRMVDRIPAYVVKNNRTGKKKVVHRAQLLLWLADYSEPVRCNLTGISNVPLGPQRINTLKEGVRVTTQCRVVVCSMAWT